MVAPGEGFGAEALQHARHICSLNCAGAGSAGGTAAAAFPSFRGASSPGAAGALLAAAPAVVAAAAVAPATAAGFVPPRAGFDSENGTCSPACFPELGCTSSVEIMFCAKR